MAGRLIDHEELARLPGRVVDAHNEIPPPVAFPVNERRSGMCVYAQTSAASAARRVTSPGRARPPP